MIHQERFIQAAIMLNKGEMAAVQEIRQNSLDMKNGGGSKVLWLQEDIALEGSCAGKAVK